MGLIRRSETKAWDPFRELEEMSARLNRLFGNGSFKIGNGGESLALSDWTPSCNVMEDDQAYIVKAELPGVDRKDVHVNVENGVLTLRGERRHEKEEKSKKLHRVESSYGSFMRSFTLPDDADEAKISASYKDGVLEIRIDKSETAKQRKPREIEIRA